ncbi:MAG: sigma-54 factor interaction domain-containing protein, partial [Bdellovibrionota bacterium]
MDSIVQFCDGIKKGRISFQEASVAPVRGRLSDAEILGVLTQVFQLDSFLRREEVSVQWSLLGNRQKQDLANLSRIFGTEIEAGDMLQADDLFSVQCDALVYIPLDTQQPKQVEHLARLSMVMPRVRHVALTASPKWNHSQLMALKETWEWLDPRQSNKLSSFAEEMIRMNGGLTRGDIQNIELPESAVEAVDPMIITRSPALKELLALVDAIADTDSTVLITGESGTGKELIANRIHARSHRAKFPHVAVNCGAIPGELLESELFGHLKGAFTGAISNREGRFEAAEQGTLFLDEIGDMGANLQVKLLRVLQTRRFEPVGSTKSKNANVRIIAATNCDLEDAVATGRFREDLFYRLNVIPVHIPPLRERQEDVPLLVDFFVKQFNRDKSRRVTGVTRA